MTRQGEDIALHSLQRPGGGVVRAVQERQILLEKLPEAQLVPTQTRMRGSPKN